MSWLTWPVAFSAAVLIAGCATAPPEPMPMTRAEDKAVSPVVREPLLLPVVPAPVVATPAVPNPEASSPPPVEGAVAPATAPAPAAAPAIATAPSTVTKPGAPASKQAAKKPSKTAPKSAAPTLASAAPTAASPAAPSPPLTAAQVALPAGTLYVCSATVNNENQQTAIEFEPRVKALCARHPEMGVCQYEREQCRAAGGRVYTSTGEEITKRTEAEYDKKVLRVRFRAG
jgi:hypothetical protein